MRIFGVFVGAALALGMCATSMQARAQAKAGSTKLGAEKAPEPPPLPPASARLWLIAPTALGPWKMRIENESAVAVRIPADGRLLRLEVQTEEGAKPVACTLPSSLRPTNFPEDRALILAPGHSYVESFDPRLYCFGKSAVTLGPNVIVRAKFGWDTPKPSKLKTKTKKTPTGPFAIESAEREPTIAPLWEIQAPYIVLGGLTAGPPAPVPGLEKEGEASVKSPEKEATDKPADKDVATNPPEKEATDKPAEKDKPAAIVPAVDERAGKLELSSTAYVEASAPRSITLSVTAKNVGLRPIKAALRPWMLSFRVDGPGLEPQICYADRTNRALPSDAYRAVAPGASTSFAVLLAEVCPKNVFPKPGLYRVTATMAAKESVNGIDAQTLSLAVKEPSYLRLTGAAEPFYSELPKAVPPVVVNVDEAN